MLYPYALKLTAQLEKAIIQSAYLTFMKELREKNPNTDQKPFPTNNFPQTI